MSKPKDPAKDYAKQVGLLKKLLDQAQRILRELPPPSDPGHPVAAPKKLKRN